MQVCVASTTTATPLASSSSTNRLAIVSVIRSCTCGTPGHHLDHAGQLAQPNHAAAGHVADVGQAHERQHVMFAHAVETDVAHQHHFVVLLGKELPQVDPRIFVQAGEQFGIHAGHAGRAFRAVPRGRDLRRRPARISRTARAMRLRRPLFSRRAAAAPAPSSSSPARLPMSATGTQVVGGVMMVFGVMLRS